jgi:hypothetical protein
MTQTTERFTLTRVNQLLYRFETTSLREIQFANPKLVGFINQSRGIDVQFEDRTYSLTGSTMWPHDVKLFESDRETLTTSKAESIGSQCYRWRTDEIEFQII